MFGITPAFGSAMWGLAQATTRFDTAAAAIAGMDPSAGVDAGSPATAPLPGSADALDLSGAMLGMLIAQRAFVAQLRVVEAASEMSREAVDLGRA